MPHYNDKTQLITVPLSLTMGWTSSPPTFCTTSETVVDMANDSIIQPPLLPHCMEKLASPHDAWAPPAPTIGQSADIMLQNRQSTVITLPHGQSTINMPSNGSSAVNMPYHGQSTINMLRDLVIPTSGDLMFPTGQSTINTLRDPVITTLGDPMIPTGQSTITTLGALVLPSCHLAPKAWPPLLLHLGPVTHVDVFIANFIGLAQGGSPTLCQHIHPCILHAVNCMFAQATVDTPNQKGNHLQKDAQRGWGLDTLKGNPGLDA